VFRGATYEVEVRNPEHVCGGVQSLTVDGLEVPGDVVPVFGDGRTHHVIALLG
jgi:cellobiose phosphorylase